MSLPCSHMQIAPTQVNNCYQVSSTANKTQCNILGTNMYVSLELTYSYDKKKKRKQKAFLYFFGQL